MSDQNDSLESNVNLEDLPESARAYLKRIEKEVIELRPLKVDNDRYKLEKELRADGMEFSDKQLKALLASHEGESTPSALRATAEELKFVEPKPATDPKDAEGHQAIDNARNGSQAGQAGVPSYAEEVANAQSMEELQKIAEKHGRSTLTRDV